MLRKLVQKTRFIQKFDKTTILIIPATGMEQSKVQVKISIDIKVYRI